MNKEYLIKLIVFLILCVIGSLILAWSQQGLVKDIPWYYATIMGLLFIIITNYKIRK